LSFQRQRFDVCEANLVGGMYRKKAQKMRRMHIFDDIDLIEVLSRQVSQDKLSSSTFRKRVLIQNLVEGYR
jgi:hypothetical protein